MRNKSNNKHTTESKHEHVLYLHQQLHIQPYSVLSDFKVKAIHQILTYMFSNKT